MCPHMLLRLTKLELNRNVGSKKLTPTSLQHMVAAAMQNMASKVRRRSWMTSRPTWIMTGIATATESPSRMCAAIQSVDPEV